MVDDPDATPTEEFHRVAAVATWRWCKSDEKIAT
jgi:hypothetical protein